MADSPPLGCGQSAGHLTFVPEAFWSLVDSKVERWTVRPWGADGPPVIFKSVPETFFVSGGEELITADGPPLGRGRSARAVMASSDMH